MEFEWREEKRLQTLKDRNIDFADAFLFFDGRPVFHQPAPRHDEDRWKSITVINGKFYTVIWTWRGDAIRIISMRRSHDQEERRYHDAFHD